MATCRELPTFLPWCLSSFSLPQACSSRLPFFLPLPQRAAAGAPLPPCFTATAASTGAPSSHAAELSPWRTSALPLYTASSFPLLSKARTPLFSWPSSSCRDPTWHPSIAGRAPSLLLPLESGCGREHFYPARRSSLGRPRRGPCPWHDTAAPFSPWPWRPPFFSSLPRPGNAWDSRPLSGLGGAAPPPAISSLTPFEMAPNSPGTFPCFDSLPPPCACQVFGKMSRETCCCSTVSAHRLVAVFTRTPHRRRSPRVRPRQSLFDSTLALFSGD
jgi:hypothetical protein